MKRPIQTKQAKLTPKEDMKIEDKDANSADNARNKYAKKTYDLNDVILAEKDFNNIHFQLLSNEKGTFVDLRRYYMHRPTQKGIRLTPEAFEEIMNFALESISEWKDNQLKEPSK